MLNQKGLAPLIILILGVLLIFSGIIGGSYLKNNSQKNNAIPFKEVSISATPTTKDEVKMSTSSANNLNDSSVLILIKNSGSTNTPPWEIKIYSDGSGDLAYGASRYPTNGIGNSYNGKKYPEGTFNQLIQTLNKIGDVALITAEHCIKSASFGSSTTIFYKGKESPDIQCVSKDSPQIYIDLSDEIRNMIKM